MKTLVVNARLGDRICGSDGVTRTVRAIAWIDETVSLHWRDGAATTYGLSESVSIVAREVPIDGA